MNCTTYLHDIITLFHVLLEPSYIEFYNTEINVSEGCNCGISAAVIRKGNTNRTCSVSVRTVDLGSLNRSKDLFATEDEDFEGTTSILNFEIGEVWNE